ncbi:MAG: hypothetical protein R2939_00780 [Kofleriaceae bacterium]
MSRGRAGWWTVALVGAAGCIADPSVVCDDGVVCPVDTECRLGVCVAPPQLRACEGLGDNDPCPLSAALTGNCVAGVCVFERCGDGLVSGAEVCDDDNQVSGDGCTATCDSDETCGNGVRDAGEACDDGNTASGDGCQAGCTLPICGDGVVDAELGEACDDGNHADGDGCAAACDSDETCGNGVRDPGEQCDDGNAADDDDCRTTCILPRCGNGVLDVGEACDDGNLASGDGCAPGCDSDETCGNGVVDFIVGEACDDGNQRSLDGCSQRCTAETLALTPRWPNLLVPPRRTNAAIAYDAARQVSVLFGGAGGNASMFDDTWEWNGVQWRWVTPVGAVPAARGGHGLAYDAARAVVVLFGGNAPSEGGNSNATWTWDGTAWHDVTPAAGSPSPRTDFAMTYDGARRRVLIFGGTTAGGVVAETWAWDGLTWREVTPAGVSPPARVGSTMAYDPDRDRTVLFGGRDGIDFFDDTWEWDGTAWQLAVVLGGPHARAEHAMAYDAARGGITIVGGRHSTFISGGMSTSYYPDSWAWDGVAWMQVPTTGLPDVADHVLSYHTATSSHLVTTGASQFELQTSTWTRGSSSSSWRKAAANAAVNLGHGAAALAADPLRGEILAVGGTTTGPSFGVSNKVHRWDGTSWREYAGARPPARDRAAIAFDPARGEIVVFGGRSSPVESDPCQVGSNLLADTWLWDGAAWQQAAPAVVPQARRDATLVADSTHGVVLLVGGNDGCDELDDTWSWDGAAWTRVAEGAAAITSRFSAAAAFDPVSGEVVLFGGRRGNQILGDTRRWDGAAWVFVAPPLDPAGAPTPRFGASLAFDGARGALRLIGGTGDDGEVGVPGSGGRGAGSRSPRRRCCRRSTCCRRRGTAA